MRLALFFRRTPDRKPRTRTEPLQLQRNWTMRDWADLPPHHPRHD